LRTTGYHRLIKNTGSVCVTRISFDILHACVHLLPLPSLRLQREFLLSQCHQTQYHLRRFLPPPRHQTPFPHPHQYTTMLLLFQRETIPLCHP
jgi:hypothetical protein